MDTLEEERISVVKRSSPRLGGLQSVSSAEGKVVVATFLTRNVVIGNSSTTSSQ